MAKDWTEYKQPTMVTDSLEVDDLAVNYEISAGTVKAKNSCTAWVNFDGTTTPPTIRDSYNVSSVIRTATGVYDIYFEEVMDNVNYSSSTSAGTNGDGASTDLYGQLNMEIVNSTTSKARFIGGYVTPVNSGLENRKEATIQIFGGKN